jgi:hypothetical protein
VPEPEPAGPVPLPREKWRAAGVRVVRSPDGGELPTHSAGDDVAAAIVSGAVRFETAVEWERAKRRELYGRHPLRRRREVWVQRLLAEAGPAFRSGGRDMRYEFREAGGRVCCAADRAELLCGSCRARAKAPASAVAAMRTAEAMPAAPCLNAAVKAARAETADTRRARVAAFLRAGVSEPGEAAAPRAAACTVDLHARIRAAAGAR